MAFNLFPTDAVEIYTADLNTLNADFGSNAEGTAILTLAAPNPFFRTLRVQIDADGLEDVSEIPGALHVGHIHGQFFSNILPGVTPAEQGDGPFFDGVGGIAVNSTEPTLANSDTDGDGFLNFLEGLPSYGPVVLNLTETPIAELEGAGYPPEGTPPLEYFLQLAGQGTIDPTELFPSGTEFELDTTYTFDLTDPDQLRQFNNLSPLDQREIVLHGLTVPLEISNAIDAAAMGASPSGVDLGNGEAFRVTAPVAAGVIERLDMASVDTLLDLTEFNGNVTADVTISREAAFDNLLQFYATNALGAVEGLLPGEMGYEDAVRRNLIAEPELFVENLMTKDTSIMLAGGTYYAPALLVQGDPNNLVTLDDGVTGMGMIQRSGNVWQFEDHNDFDFNDLEFTLNSVDTTVAA